MDTDKTPSFLSQLKAMLIRNFLLKRRQKGRTFMEIFLPLYCFAILSTIKFYVRTPHLPVKDKSWGTEDLFDSYLSTKNHTIAIVPDTNGTRLFALELNNLWRSKWKNQAKFKFIKNKNILEHMYWTEPKSFETAVIFKSQDPMQGKLDYELQVNPNYRATPSTNDLYGSPEFCRVPPNAANLITIENCPAYQYYYSGFVALQTLIDFAKIKIDSAVDGSQVQNISLPSINLELFPKAAFTVSDSVFRGVLSMCMVWAFAQMISYALIVIVGEKEKKIKEGMKIMGLRDSVYWISWFIVYAVIVLIISIISTVLLFKLQIFQHSDFVLVFLMILFFGFSVIMLAFMITPFFDKSRTAGILGNFAVSILGLFYFISTAVDSSSSGILWIISLISCSGFALAFNKALVMERSGEGVTFSNMWDRAGMSFGDIILMLVLDTILYGFLAYYLDAVIPSEYGRKQSPWFPFTFKYWFTDKNKAKISCEETYEETDNPDMEPVPKEMKNKEAIRIVNLSKSFQKCKKPEVKAVDGFNLKIYEGQITALLGHNGAGKTTLFNILTGLTTPTAGTIRIYGQDIRDPNGIMKIHWMTGVCPQHDVLIDLLTPREHLEFFAAIRGVPSSELRSEVEKTLKDLDLEENADTLVKFLSGGQKRKLSVGIAIIGDPKIIILDEPTAGVDLFSRQHLWSILQNRKHDKVILLTTHFMNEADVLADRKAVISKGHLRCCGTSLFLKNKFGIGYRLTLELGNSTDDNVTGITNLVTQFVPKAEYSRRFVYELSFILPHDSVNNFAPLFSTIEKQITLSEGRNIKSYGVSMTTLEEVFLQLQKSEEEESEMIDLSKTNGRRKLSKTFESRVCSYQNLQNDCETNELNQTADAEVEVPSNESIIKSFSSESIATTTPSSVLIFFVLLKIRLFRFLRDYKLLYSMLLFPILFSICGLLLFQGPKNEPKLQSLTLNEGTYSTGISIAMHNETSHSVSSLVSHFGSSINIDWYNGSYKSLLNTTPHFHMAAINITECCKLSNLSFTITYNDTEVHSLPVVINSINNAIYRMVQTKKIGSQNDILAVSAHPFPELTTASKFYASAIPLSFWLGSTILLVPINLAIDLIHDREVKAKNQLRVNGLSFMSYFGSYFIIFTGIMFLLCSGLLGTLFLFHHSFVEELAAVFPLALIIFGIFCPSSLIFTSCLSYAFDKTETAQSILSNICTFLGIIPFIIIIILDLIEIDNITFIVHAVFSLVDPMYIPYSIFYELSKVQRLKSFPHLSRNLFDLFSKEIVALFVCGLLQILIYFCVLLLLDFLNSGGNFNCLRNLFWSTQETHKETNDATDQEDDDVKTERQRVERILTENSSLADHPIIVQNLRKEFNESSSSCNMLNTCKSGKDAQSSVKVALKGLSLAVDSGEVFGLLGHNGAGKTTAIKVIIAEETPTKGRVQINGRNITSGVSNVFQYVGYCPQHDAQWETITVREHLELYSYIRGVPTNRIQRVIDSLLSGLRIEEYANTLSRECSGGTKRKLSFAMAMIGNPCVVLMDEPSSGMDPYSKHFLWDTIVASFQGKRGAILTTHSMDEADALCTRVGIMVKGELRCIGTTQHLKNLYGAGYTLEIKLQNSASLSERHSAIKLFVAEMFADASLESDFIGRLVYKVPQQTVVSLSECFARLEQAKSKLDIEEYSFSQTTLEQVFLKFALYDEGE